MMLTRRELSGGLLLPFGLAAAESAFEHPSTPARRRATRVFKEIAASVYAWDLVDQPCEEIMETLKETTHANSLYLVALMHQEKRPYTDLYFPHNTTWKTYFAEDSRIYWEPHAECYQDSKIKPLRSAREEFRKIDFLDVTTKAARKAGWKTGAEISHTILDKQRAAGEFRSVVQKDIFGRPSGQLICPNNPMAMAYLIGLFTDVVKNYDVDFVQTCLRPFGDEDREESSPMERVLESVRGTCFCDSCFTAAKAEGFDLKAAQKAMLPLANAASRNAELADEFYIQKLRASNTSAEALLLQHPEIFDWLRFRCNSMTRMFARVHDTLKSIKPAIDVRINAYIDESWELHGIEYKPGGPPGIHPLQQLR
jgi:hypothetical protein